MEDLEGQQTDMPIRRRLIRLDKYLSDDRKADFNGGVNGMEKAETVHRPTGESRFEGLGRMLSVEQAGIAKEMNMEEHKKDKQAEAAADPRSQMFGHWRMSCIALQARLVNNIVQPESHALSVMNPFTRGRKRSLQADKKSYLLLEAGPADGLQQV